MIFTGIALQSCATRALGTLSAWTRISARAYPDGARTLEMTFGSRYGWTMADDVTTPPGLPMTTGLEFPDMQVTQTIGVIYGLVVRSMGVVGGVAAGFKALRRGEVSQYTGLLEESRRHAIDRMVDNARLVDADGLIAVRFDSSEIGQQLTEILAYGTAVKLAPRA
jgi:uncharacterized protein YbjQ (UPF0145 family)